MVVVGLGRASIGSSLSHFSLPFSSSPPPGISHPDFAHFPAHNFPSDFPSLFVGERLCRGFLRRNWWPHGWWEGDGTVAVRFQSTSDEGFDQHLLKVTG